VSAGLGSRREATKQANRAAILAAAREVFADLGYEAASVRDVIGRTGLASGTFYNYFPDKASVFRAVLEEAAARINERTRAARSAADGLEATIHDGYHAYFAFLAEDPLTLRLLRRNAGAIRSVLDAPSVGTGMVELRDDYAAAAARGLLPAAVDVDYLTAAMTGVGVELALRMIEREPVDPDGAAVFATRLFLGGIAALAAS
jgi:AcrR family transcriptional regulator